MDEERRTEVRDKRPTVKRKQPLSLTFDGESTCICTTIVITLTNIIIITLSSTSSLLSSHVGYSMSIFQSLLVGNHWSVFKVTIRRYSGILDKEIIIVSNSTQLYGAINIHYMFIKSINILKYTITSYTSKQT